MFDVGFSELCLIGLVSLLVIGPERLPKAARLAGFWLGKTRSVAASVKEEIKLELQAEEMRQIFKEQAGLQDGIMAATAPGSLTAFPLSMEVRSGGTAPRTEEAGQRMEQLPTDSAEQHEPK
ncbi:MAG: Sec-independent protein translocase protein TatB [Methylobacter sp.]